MFYATFSPILIAYCERNPVYYDGFVGLEYRNDSSTHTRKRIFGPNSKVEQLSISCNGKVRVLDQ